MRQTHKTTLSEISHLNTISGYTWKNRVLFENNFLVVTIDSEECEVVMSSDMDDYIKEALGINSSNFSVFSYVISGYKIIISYRVYEVNK